jgi:hypothetical protein
MSDKVGTKRGVGFGLSPEIPSLTQIDDRRYFVSRDMRMNARFGLARLKSATDSNVNAVSNLKPAFKLKHCFILDGPNGSGASFWM